MELKVFLDQFTNFVQGNVGGIKGWAMLDDKLYTFKHDTSSVGERVLFLADRILEHMSFSSLGTGVYAKKDCIEKAKSALIDVSEVSFSTDFIIDAAEKIIPRKETWWELTTSDQDGFWFLDQKCDDSFRKVCSYRAVFDGVRRQYIYSGVYYGTPPADEKKSRHWWRVMTEEEVKDLDTDN